MKTVAPALLGCGTLLFGVRIVRRDATVLAYTEHDVDQTVNVDGVDTLLLSNPGFNIQSLVSTSGLDVDNTELQVIASEDIRRVDILAGVWDGAEVFFFRYSWRDPSAGIIEVKRGSFGGIAPQFGQFKIEFRDLRQALQQDSTWQLQMNCRWRVFDARCTLDEADFTVVGAVTSVASSVEFTDTSLTQVDDYFGEGVVRWLTGDNAGLQHKVSQFAAGVVTLAYGVVIPIQVGDTFNIVAGCRKRLQEDCITKFANGLNNGGEPDKPTRDDMIQAPPQTG